MKDKLIKRLEELKEEYDSGKKILMELNSKESELQQNMLRISGAIQVLEEELKKEQDEGENVSVLDINTNPEKTSIQG